MIVAEGRTLARTAAPPLAPPRVGALLRAHRTGVTRLVAVAVALGLWQALAGSGLVSPLFFSSPGAVAGKIAELAASGALWRHLATSGQEAAVGFALAVAVGLPIGVLMGRVRLVRDVLEPFVVAKYSAPTVAFLPLLIIWLGIGAWSKIALVFLGAVFVVIVNAEAGAASVDRRLVETARAFTASEWQVVTKVVLPWSIPFLLAGLRLAVGRVLIMVVVAEMYASTGGLGYLVFQGVATYDATTVFAGAAVLAAIGVVLNQALRALERRAAPWRAESDS
jgi:ABC-type nitrate/sulfonate/bicarbonate transport system permease component